MTGKTFVMTLAALGWAGAALSGESFRYVVFDEDNDHFFKSPETWMDVAHLEAYVDRIAADGKATHVFFCPTGGRASFDSKTWEPILTLQRRAMPHPLANRRNK